MEEFLSKNAIYIVMIIVLIVWAGVFGFLLVLNNRIKNIEKEIKGDTGK
ncbi:MAG: CcmD family protein [Ignavibacteria bacterium CG_4_8_14_3_um_filter_37_9]|nr:CcmD family protein [Ignavibacteria bacterium]PIP76950.1 MAG: CcmD family protein [Ignavibacteria bacterium CG22_combo_CG10-13_8_21_14_all_37_15]PIS46366.1 MAG: CcmD family protein [Ignavibacteria bacterium CG08_land_8_20_14_0_20_37_9]PIW99171.1 MAG: CcmD family protein [Ignavibacteria bacterium CG_4_8_14_3_um_filter_37_9]PIX93451.1 MAG: CcmD family protein [Ignavibacteria bacterium CG_4_10_14_3_um_filter_37_18]PJC57794.1 MAG: CcmD family protein [Ignavibacteria bacterium CG_4_9_14_0_2_um_f